MRLRKVLRVGPWPPRGFNPLGGLFRRDRFEIGEMFYASGLKKGITGGKMRLFVLILMFLFFFRNTWE